MSFQTKLLDFGYKQLSRFGRWCPVKLLQSQPVPPHFGDDKRPLTATHRSFVYFLSSREAKRRFLAHPLHFLRQPSPPPAVPPRLCVLGPPKCGKTALATRFAKELGCVRLSAGEAVRAILDKQPHTALAHEIRQFLLRGKTVPDELAVQCLEVGTLLLVLTYTWYVRHIFFNSEIENKLFCLFLHIKVYFLVHY